MQAIIERATPSVRSQRVLPENRVQEPPRPYRAPLATFLTLVASARASAGAGATGAPRDPSRLADVDV